MPTKYLNKWNCDNCHKEHGNMLMAMLHEERCFKDYYEREIKKMYEGE